MFWSTLRVESNRVNDEDLGLDRIWIWWVSRQWEVEILIRNEKFIHCEAKNRGGLDNLITMVYGSSTAKRERIFGRD